MDTTARYALPYPELTDAADIDEAVRPLAQAVDATFVGFTQGLLLARPVAGIVGRRYYATDADTEFLDLGVGWVAIGPSVLKTGAVQTAHLAAGAVTDAKIAATLKPSGGAGGTVEALRALGEGATQAYPGSSGAALAANRRTGLAQRSGSTGPLSAGVWTAIDLNVEQNDPDGMIAAGVFFIPAPGTYEISGRVHNDAAAGLRARVFDVDTGTPLMMFGTNDFEDIAIPAFAWPCSAGTTLRLEVMQPAGGTTLTSVIPYATFLAVSQVQ